MNDKTLWQMKTQLARARVANAIISADIRLLKLLGWCMRTAHHAAERLTNWIYPEGADCWNTDTALEPQP